MMFNATFNNISVISWRSALLVEKTGETYRPVVSYWPISGKLWLQRQLSIQLPYDHDHDGPETKIFINRYFMKINFKDAKNNNNIMGPVPLTDQPFYHMYGAKFFDWTCEWQYVSRYGINVSHIDRGYVRLVVSTSRSFPHSWLIMGCVTSGAGTACPSGASEFTPVFQ